MCFAVCKAPRVCTISLLSSEETPMFLLNPASVTLPHPRRIQPSRPGTRDLIENLEAREMLSVAPAAIAVPAAVTGPAIHSPLNHVNAAKHVSTVLPLTITGVSVVNGALVATGQLGHTTFTTPVTLGLEPGSTAAVSPAATTPILHLMLGPIHLNLLGLHVDTSAICLNIDAQSGSGNLLGNLLTGVANLLNGGTPLGNILGGLSGTNLNTLLDGITGLLNGVLGQVTAPSSLAGVTTGALTSAAATPVNILHLSLGPVDLNLLGLLVHLDNCANGPVTVDITAVPGPGNLLGNLLGGLAHLLDTPASQQAVAVHLDHVAQEIQSLI